MILPSASSAGREREREKRVHRNGPWLDSGRKIKASGMRMKSQCKNILVQ